MVNVEIKDNHESATLGALKIVDLCEKVREPRHLESDPPPARVLTGARVGPNPCAPSTIPTLTGCLACLPARVLAAGGDRGP